MRMAFVGILANELVPFASKIIYVLSFCRGRIDKVIFSLPQSRVDLEVSSLRGWRPGEGSSLSLSDMR